MPAETRDAAEVDERSQPNIKVRVQLDKGDGGGAATDVEGLVSALSDAYRKFYAWDVIVSQAELDSVADGHSREKPIKQLSSYAADMPAEDQLQVVKVQTTSPAIFEITGAPRPLQRLQWYFDNRRVDWDREAKEPSEDRRLELEAQRTDAVREQVDLLHQLGFPEIQIREALKEYVFGPLDRLERFAAIKFVLPKPQEK